MGWDSGEQIVELGAYAEWELAQARVEFGDDLAIPIFVRLKMDGSERDMIVLDWVRAMPTTHRGHRFISDFELDHLASVRETRAYNPEDFMTCIYCRPEAIFDELWTVVSAGSPLPMPKVRDLAYEGTPLIVPMEPMSGPPIVAIIDDAIGFLNARFRAGPVTTRFNAVWIMSRVANPIPNAGPPINTVTGQVLETADINNLLAQGRDEAAIYHDLNDTVFDFGQHKGLNLRAGHGTHILDIAAGHDPTAQVPGGPLIAVQLPAEAIIATSGRRLETHILIAMRWILSRARMIAATTGVLHPVIINLSLGALAGPKDGTGWFEQRLNKLLADPAQVPPNMTVRVCAAFGNARRDRLTLNAPLPTGGSCSFDWRIQPDDGTSSYLEIRVPKGSASHLKIEIAPPGRIPTLALPRLPTATEMQTYMEGGDLVAGVYAMAEVNFDAVLVAVNATRPDLTAAPADAGAWRFALKNVGGPPCDLSARVQRDDTPYGFRIAGRQSWLDAPDAWEWDSETMDWSAPSAQGISRAQTDVDYSSAASASLYLVAASEPDPLTDGDQRPARYSAEGGGPHPTHPTLTAMADRGRMRPGRRASGILSGSTAVFSGTSIATPQVTRALTEQIRAGAPVQAQPVGDMPPSPEVYAMLKQTSAGPTDPRIGAGFLPPGDIGPEA